MIRKFRIRKIGKDTQNELKIMVTAICKGDEDAEVGVQAICSVSGRKDYLVSSGLCRRPGRDK